MMSRLKPSQMLCMTAALLLGACADAEPPTEAELDPKSDGSDVASEQTEPVEGEALATGGTCGQRSFRAGDTRGTINVGGRMRSYILHVPSSYRGTQPVPLLVDLHPLMMTNSYQRSNSGYAAIADREGFLVVYPQGLNNSWNIGPCCTKDRNVDDVAFVRALVNKIKGEGCVDDKRVYAAGYSNGGGLSHYLACKASDVFAAVSPAAFDMITEVPCTPTRPISVISFRGTADAIVPYNGGASRPPTAYPLPTIHFLGAEKTFQTWAKLNKCTGAAVQGDRAGCRTYQGCADGVEVTLCTKTGGGHQTGDATYGWSHMKRHTLP